MKFFVKIISALILFNAIMACGNLPSGDTPGSTTTYTVTFDSQFNNTESTTTMPNPTSITLTSPTTTVSALPTAPTMSGFIFGGWWTEKGGTGVRFTTSTSFSSDLTVYAYWYKYQVAFYSDSTTVYQLRGTVPPATTVDTLPTAPTKTGYTFAGWWTGADGGGTQFTVSTPVTSNMIVYAKWTANTVYAVTYDSDGGSTVGTQYVISPATTVGTLPANPTKPFYNFEGWFTGQNGSGSAFDGATEVTANVTIYADWTSHPGYTVTYNSYGGTSVDTQYVYLPDTTVGALPSAPTKRCYAFSGWYTGTGGSGDEFDETTPVTANITVYANWTWNYPSATYPLIEPPLAIGNYGPSCVGKVFYISDSGNHGLEAAPMDWYNGSSDPSAPWIYGGDTQSTLNGNTSTDIGTGSANSKAIVDQVTAAGGTTTAYAAQLCLDYSVGSGSYVFDDWYLPSKDELAQLYANKDAGRWGGFSDYRYWSSSEYTAGNAWSQHLILGTQQGTYKSYELLVRPVRAF